MARSSFKLNSKGVRKLLNSSSTRALLTDKADGVLGQAQANAPVASGSYRSSIHIEQATTDRAVVRVVADDPKALILEAQYGVLASALDGVGGPARKMDYTTKSGKKIKATQAQIDNWTRGSA